MNPAIILLFAQIALKIGPALYGQLSDLFEDQIPTWDDLAAENAELQAMIDAEKA